MGRTFQAITVKHVPIRVVQSDFGCLYILCFYFSSFFVVLSLLFIYLFLISSSIRILTRSTITWKLIVINVKGTKLKGNREIHINYVNNTLNSFRPVCLRCLPSSIPPVSCCFPLPHVYKLDELPLLATASSPDSPLDSFLPMELPELTSSINGYNTCLLEAFQG